MSSSKGDSPKSEKQRIWELEEQLDDEQYAHRKTKSALRSVQEKLEKMNVEKEANVENSDLLESLMRENQDLKSKLKERDLRFEEQMDLVADLKRDNQNLRIENSILENSGQEKTEIVKMLNNEKAELKRENEEMERMNESLKEKLDMIEDLKRGIQDLTEINKELLGNSGSERDELRIQLKDQSEKLKDYEKDIHDLRQQLSDLEKSNQEALEPMKLLESERDEMRMELEQQPHKMKDYETRLKEYEEEVNRLNETRRSWMFDYWKMIGRLIEVLKNTHSNEDPEEVKKLEEDKKEAENEFQWWDDYFCVCCDLSAAFATINYIMNGCLRSKEQLDSNQYYLNDIKQLFEERSGRLRSGMEGEEWIKKDLESKHFETWQQLLNEASEKINKS